MKIQHDKEEIRKRSSKAKEYEKAKTKIRKERKGKKTTYMKRQKLK